MSLTIPGDPLTILRLALALGLVAAPLAAKTPTQKKNEAKAAAAKAATEQKKQHRESVKAQKEQTKAIKEAGKKKR